MLQRLTYLFMHCRGVAYRYPFLEHFDPQVLLPSLLHLASLGPRLRNTLTGMEDRSELQGTKKPACVSPVDAIRNLSR